MYEINNSILSLCQFVWVFGFCIFAVSSLTGLWLKKPNERLSHWLLSWDNRGQNQAEGVAQASRTMKENQLKASQQIIITQLCRAFRCLSGKTWLQINSGIEAQTGCTEALLAAAGFVTAMPFWPGRICGFCFSSSTVLLVDHCHRSCGVNVAEPRENHKTIKLMPYLNNTSDWNGRYRTELIF